MSYVIQAVLSNAQHPEYGQVTIPLWSMGVGIKSKSSERCQPTE